MLQNEVYFGTSGLLLPVPNKQFYPEEFKEKSRLNYYGSLMNSIEINSSFYKIPQAKTVQRWSESVPENFRFTFKLWREITHNKGLVYRDQDVFRFMEVISATGDKKGSLLVQFPPSVTYGNRFQVEKLIDLIKTADPSDQWDIAVEFRHPGWYREETADMLADRKIAIVLHDKSPAVTPFNFHESNFIYLRFHGPGGDYRGNYDDATLAEYAGYIREWVEDGKRVYVYFNNTVGNALQNLNDLRDLVLQD